MAHADAGMDVDQCKCLICSTLMAHYTSPISGHLTNKHGVTTTKKDVFCFLKSPPIEQEVVVKKEHIEVDNKVFVGEGEVANEQFKDNKYELNEGKVEKEQIESLKTRHSAMTSILDKLEKKNQQLTLSERASKLDKVEVKQN